MRNEPNLRVNQYRMKGEGIFPDTPDGANHGRFQIGPLTITSSGTKGGTGWEHVSISGPRRTPTWTEMEKVKQLFWGDKQTVIQFHPMGSEYINIHPNCLHLWRSEGQDHLLPPAMLV